ncbi:MAG TPA: class I mannose-6-phosphate isomerase [Fibrobacteria bacterium]|nr:class I mannose-6-phosphate isomerase [Fibrobacteria bacterium]HOX52011.1 class I mannose-6-phosphate isomerase [Fibrobacteria bacterium]
MNPSVSVPLFPVPRLMERPWGGSGLRAWGRPCLEGVRIGESWELGCFPGFDSSLEGTSHTLLSQAMVAGNDPWPGCAHGVFPLLVKLIDARETLSIQVHPSVASADAAPKNECWLVLEAPKGGFLYAGTTRKLDSSELVSRLGAGDTEVLARIPVKTGDVVMIPAGTIHAITAGLVVAEVQQASDTTYRLWDWGRTGLDGKPRELHLDLAKSCLDPAPNPGLKPVPVAIDGFSELLCATPWFALKRIRPGTGERIEGHDGFRILMVLEGPMDLSWEGGRKSLERGRFVILPPHAKVRIAGGLALETWVPNWDRDVLGPVLSAGHSREMAYQLSAGIVRG